MLRIIIRVSKIRIKRGKIMVYLARHGQTDWNLKKMFNGCTDTELNDIGIEESRKQADDLKSICIDKCFCSPLRRARQTGEIIFNGIAVVDQRLLK